MKRALLVVIFALSLFFVGSASATDYTYATYCSGEACLPFYWTNSYVRQQAINFAYSNSLPVGTDVTVIYDGQIGQCEMVWHTWTVNHVPTLNSTHVTYREGWCIYGGNQ